MELPAINQEARPRAPSICSAPKAQRKLTNADWWRDMKETIQENHSLNESSVGREHPLVQAQKSSIKVIKTWLDWSNPWPCLGLEQFEAISFLKRPWESWKLRVFAGIGYALRRSVLRSSCCSFGPIQARSISRSRRGEACRTSRQHADFWYLGLFERCRELSTWSTHHGKRCWTSRAAWPKLEDVFDFVRKCMVNIGWIWLWSLCLRMSKRRPL